MGIRVKSGSNTVLGEKEGLGNANFFVYSFFFSILYVHVCVDMFM